MQDLLEGSVDLCGFGLGRFIFPPPHTSRAALEPRVLVHVRSLFSIPLRLAYTSCIWKRRVVRFLVAQNSEQRSSKKCWRFSISADLSLLSKSDPGPLFPIRGRLVVNLKPLYLIVTRLVFFSEPEEYFYDIAELLVVRQYLFG